MEPQLPIWEPTTAEVEQILDELRPLIRGFARRDRVELAGTGLPVGGGPGGRPDQD
jgi:hypothetical protein